MAKVSVTNDQGALIAQFTDEEDEIDGMHVQGEFISELRRNVRLARVEDERHEETGEKLSIVDVAEQGVKRRRR